ncbi:hypothetical protein ACQHIH_21220 (plasmid) [Xanthomonas sontii]|uniref:hypothetical protein n=1 Tax=Xanthomonas sontii TaxID=2650745 RepID=UPI003F842C9F
MATATTFLIVVPIVMLIVTFLPPYSRAFGFDQAPEAEVDPKPLPQLASVAEDVTEDLAPSRQLHASPVIHAELPLIAPGLGQNQLPAPHAADADDSSGMTYVDAIGGDEFELVDVPADWKPGGKHARSGLIRYVDFSEQDRYSIDDGYDSEKVSFETTFDDPEVLDVVRGYWRAHEELAAST